MPYRLRLVDGHAPVWMFFRYGQVTNVECVACGKEEETPHDTKLVVGGNVVGNLCEGCARSLEVAKWNLVNRIAELRDMAVKLERAVDELREHNIWPARMNP